MTALIRKSTLNVGDFLLYSNYFVILLVFHINLYIQNNALDRQLPLMHSVIFV